MKKRIIFSLFAAVLTITAFAQGRKGLIINEVMVENTSSIVDEYGVHTAWVELMNTTHGTMDISSVFITNVKVAEGEKPDPKNLYCIPRGDVKTKIKPLQQAVFFCDGEANKGTFHVNFTLYPGCVNYIALYDADGLTLIDEVEVPADLTADHTYALDKNYVWTVRSLIGEDHATPGTRNDVIEGNKKVNQFRENDPFGVILTILAMAIVFLALILLSVCFYLFGRLNASVARRNKADAHDISSDQIRNVAHDTGEEIAAICMALNQHLNAHDQENTVLTINKVKRAYSPWSSKIYTLRQTPQR
ncbi:MAG: OadG family protein [Muribaculaceae bacterium]|nr:OadG family protein [Muribaculaceae bacterium]